MPDGTPRIDPDAVAGRIATLLQDRRSNAAKPLLAALEKLAPDHPDLAPLLAAYWCQIRDVPRALTVLQEAIVRQPGNAALYLRRAEILFGQADYAGAAGDAAEAILARPDLTRAKSVLGLALLKLGQFDAALPCLAESFAADPAAVDVALALAALVPARAAVILEEAIAATPQLGVLRNALTRRHLCAGDNAAARQNAMRTSAAGLADAETFCLLAFAQMQEGCWDAADAAVSRAQQLAPDHPWPGRLAAALAGREASAFSPPLQRDALAAEQEALDSGSIFRRTIRDVLQETHHSGPVLDLFCGTGLNAAAAQAICPGPWTGIEPDPALLRLCEARGQYLWLEPCSPLGFLQRGAQSIVLLNEALAYGALLQPWFTALRACLMPNGIALAAIPAGRSALTGHGLFAHAEQDIAGQAQQAGLCCSFWHSGILRYVAGIPLYGVIASFEPL